VVPVLACGVIVWMLGSVTLREWAVTVGVLAAAAVVFLLTRAHRAGVARASVEGAA
jgi:hypothetical protein